MQNSDMITRDGFGFRYSIEGSGTPILVIGSAIYYQRIFSAQLRKHAQLIFIDHRGFAQAPAAYKQEYYELEVVLDDTEYIRQKLGLGRVAVLGHSGHGYMALEYAKKYPEHVSHVVIIGTGADHSTQSHAAADEYFNAVVCPERKKQLALDLALLPAELEAYPACRFITFCLRLRARSWYKSDFDAAHLWDGVTINMPIIDHLWGGAFTTIDVTHGLEKLEKPVLLALGMYDFLVAPFYTWQPLKHHFKNMTYVVFEKSGHTPQYEEPDLFNQTLLDWLSGKPELKFKSQF